MAIDPVDLIGGLATTDNVSKEDFRAYEKARNIGIMATVSEVNDTDLSARSTIFVAENQSLYRKNTADQISEDNGGSILIDASGAGRWYRISIGQIQPDAVGDFADRGDYDDELLGFIYLSQDGDGGSVTDGVLFVKASDASGDWSDAILIRGERGGDRYEISNWDSDRPASGEEVIAHIITTNVSFPAGFTESYARALVASTGAAAYSIQKNGVQIGTLTFTGSTTGVFAMASPAAFVAGDRFSLVAPNPRNSTLSGVSMTVVGTR
mgnify:CR=1 FL=1